jgi:sugar lactone lactonase YvrE
MKRSRLHTVLGAALLAVASVSRAADTITFTGGDIFPESITSTADGTLYISSAARTIYRALPGASTAEPWIETEESAARSVFGVLADERTRTLYACTGTVGEITAPPPPSALYTFDLTSGAAKGRHVLPTPNAICNDIAVASAGRVYVTDTGNAQILELRDGKLEVWSQPGPFGDRQSVLDGIAVLGDRVLVNTLRTNRLIGVPILRDGSASTPYDIVLDLPLDAPDGMRPMGQNMLVIGENRRPGRVVVVTLQNDRGTVTELDNDLEHGSVAVTLTPGNVWYVAPFAYENGPPKRFKAVRVPFPAARATVR